MRIRNRQRISRAVAAAFFPFLKQQFFFFSFFFFQFLDSGFWDYMRKETEKENGGGRWKLFSSSSLSSFSSSREKPISKHILSLDTWPICNIGYIFFFTQEQEGRLDQSFLYPTNLLQFLSVPQLNKIGRSSDFKAQKLWKGSSGSRTLRETRLWWHIMLQKREWERE